MKSKLLSWSILFIVFLATFTGCKKSEDDNSCSSLKNEYNASWGRWNGNPTPANCEKCKLAINNYLNSNCISDATERQQIQLNRDLVVIFCP